LGEIYSLNTQNNEFEDEFDYDEFDENELETDFGDE